jgi:hypothetical protein
MAHPDPPSAQELTHAASLEPAASEALERDLVALASRHDRLGTGDAIAIPATYLEAVATKR